MAEKAPEALAVAAVPAQFEHLSDEVIDKMLAPALKDALKERGQAVDGIKATLKTRLKEYMLAHPPASGAVEEQDVQSLPAGYVETALTANEDGAGVMPAAEIDQPGGTRSPSPNPEDGFMSAACAKAFPNHARICSLSPATLHVLICQHRNAHAHAAAELTQAAELLAEMLTTKMKISTAADAYKAMCVMGATMLEWDNKWADLSVKVRPCVSWTDQPRSRLISHSRG